MVIHTDGIRTVSNAPPPKRTHCKGCGDPYAPLRGGECATCRKLGPLYALADIGRAKETDADRYGEEG